MSVRTTLFAVSIIPFTATNTHCQVADRTSFVRSVDSMARLALKNGPAAGIAIAVARGRDIVLAKGYGFADLENQVPVSERTVFRVGSITKQFTASIILQLVQEGRLSLDDSLGEFVPQLSTQGTRVLVRHLLNHTSGIKSYTRLGPRFWSRARLPMPLDTLIAMLKDVPFDFKPGERWLYNNSGYYLLGSIIERVTGKSYAENIQERIARPLGLASTLFCETRPLISHRAQGYVTSNAGLVNADFLDMSGPFAAGSLCSTATDLVRWQAALASGQVVSPASFQLMTTPDTTITGERLTYGYGLGVGDLEGHRRISHGGGINGFATHLAWFPNDSLVIVVLVNTESQIADGLTTRIARRALGIVPPAISETALPAGAAAAYTGDYATGDYRVQVSLADGRLVIQAPDDQPTPLLYQGGEAFVSQRDPDQKFVFQMEGQRASGFSLLIDGRTAATLSRVD